MLTLKAEHATVQEVLSILCKFAEISNLVVNMEKSTVLPIGKAKNTPISGMEPFRQAVLEPVDYLSVPIQNDLNIDNSTLLLMKEWFQQVTNTGNTSEYTLLGRIVIIKTLLTSILVNPFSFRPSFKPSVLHQLQSMLMDYIWQGGRHYINKHTYYLPWDIGGINMVNIELQEETLKFHCINKLFDNTGWIVENTIHLLFEFSCRMGF